jgi:Helix-turn-helix domain
MERLSVQEKQRIAELVVEGAPFWRLRREVDRSRWAIARAVRSLQRPATPTPTRSPLRLSQVEREEISRGLAAGESLRLVARRLGRAPSTVSREVKVNGGRRRCRACRADRAAVRRARRPKPCKLAQCRRLRAAVEAKLERCWSPRQISGWLVREFPDDAEMRVSHETIYQSLFVQSRGALPKELTRYFAHRTCASSPTRPADPQRARSDPRPGAHQRTARRSRRPSRARPLGGRFVVRARHQRRRHARRATQPLRDADRLTDRPHRRCRRRRTRGQDLGAPSTAAPLAHVGSRQRDGPTRAIHRRDRCARVLLRSQKSLAAGLQREHQRTVAPIPAAHHQYERLPASAPRRHRRRTQRPASTNPRLALTITSTRPSDALTA